MAIDRNIKILIVDDEETVLVLMRKALEILGFNNLLQTTSGEQALELFKNNNDIALVFSDLQMTPISGLHLLTAVREQNKTVPFIMVTASTDTADILEAKQKGADHYLSKPFDVKSIKYRMELIFQDQV